MIIKKYIANTLEQAMQLLRQELGPDAVVLTTRHIQRKGIMSWLSPSKVEVTAAVEENELKAFNERKEGKTPRKKSQEQKAPPRTPVHKGVGDLSGKLAELKKSLREEEAPAQMGTYGDPRLARRKGPDQFSLSQDAQRVRQQQELGKEDQEHQGQEFAAGVLRASQGLLHAFADELHDIEEKPEKQATAPLPAPPTVPPTPSNNDHSSIRQIIREEMSRAQASVSVGSLEQNDEDTVGSVRFLMGKGIARPTALGIEKKLKERFGQVDLSRATPQRKAWLNAMKTELEQLVKTTGPLMLQAGKPTVMAIVGPTGVGKTTTLAKIAAQYSHDGQRKVGVITLDTEKMGAREQIKGLTDVLRIPLMTASNGKELRQAVNAFADRQLILIDTAGCCRYQGQKIDRLVETLSAVPEAKISLAISAATKDVDAFGAIREFSRMSLDSLIMTKTDETIALGLIVNACSKTGLPIRFLSTGTEIPGDLVVAEAGELAKGLLVKYNAAEYDALRRMASA